MCSSDLISFTLGVLAAEVWLRGHVPSWLKPELAALMLVAMVTMDLALPSKLDGHRIVFSVMATVAVLAVVQVPESRWAGWWRPFVRGGNDSYALYLAHPLVLSVGGQVLRRVGGASPVVAASGAVALVGLSLVVARQLHEQFEQPMHRRTNAWVKRRWPAG